MNDVTKAMQDIQDDSDLRQRIVQAGADLNYWGKKLASSKLIVCETLYETFIAYALNVDAIQSILNEATPPKKPKAEKQTKEKAVDTRPVSAGAVTHAEETRPILVGKRFLITSAQNNTDVHKPFLENLEAYAYHIGAQILVFPFIYNKNGFQNGEGSEEIWYASEVRQYLQKESVWLTEGYNDKKVAAMAFNILPTVKNPLGGMKEAIGSAEALIVPHATLAHECVAVLGAQFGRVVPGMYSTGTVTQRNYIQQQAGHKAENRHNFAALIVEFNDHGQFWIRQIETDETGAFCDLKTRVSSFGVVENVATVDAINYGDIHAEKLDHDIAAIQWGASNSAKLSMLDYFHPRYQMAHDLLDFQALNHHNRDNHYHMAENQFSGRTVADDLKDVTSVLDNMGRDWCQTIIVRSNHDDALDRWLADAKYEPRKDPANALTYYRLQVEAYERVKDGVHFDSLPVALFQNADWNGNETFLRASQSFKVGPVELGEHGHSGVNGSRGSPKQFASQKCTTGHTHTPSIYGGCYTAGVSGKLAMGYNETGASSWQHACVVQYITGFRTIMHVKPNGDGGLAYMA